MEASRGRREGGWAAVSKKPSASGTKSAYDDVFGGPPRFAAAAAAAARMNDYTEIFGGLVASCSIPFLDLPPAGDVSCEPPTVGHKGPVFDYSEVFGGFDFGEFAATYEELLAESRREGAVGSSDGRAPKKSNSQQQATETFELPLEQRNGNNVPCLEDDQISSNSSRSDGDSKHLNPSYNNLRTCFREYAISGITNTTELHAVPGFSCTMLEGKPLETEKGGTPHSVLHVEINDEKLQDKSFHTLSGDDSKISRDDVATERIQTCSHDPRPENDHASMKHESRPSSSHSVSSGNTSSSDVTYVSISEINLQTQPSRVPPPSRPPPKMFNKQVHPIVKMHTNSKSDLPEGGSCKPILSHKKLSNGFISERHMDQEVVKESSPFSFDVEVDVSEAAASSAAAIKEAMELAQARLQSAKEMMEMKRDSFQSRKKMDHSADIKHKERVADQDSAGTENLNPMLIKKTMVNEVKQDSVDLKEENTRENSVGISPQLEKIGHVVFAVEHEQMAAQNDLKSTKLGMGLEKASEKWKLDNSGVEKEPEKWKVNKEYYELTSNEKKFIKVSEIPEQEAFRNKVKETLKLSEEKKRENLEDAAVLEFENNTQWNNANEKSQKEDYAESMRNDDINFVEERVRVTSEMVPEALMHENVIILEEAHAHHGEESEKLEEVQGVHVESENVPHAGECDPVFLEKVELSNDSMSQLNHDRIYVEGKSQYAKVIPEIGQHSYEFKAIHNSQDDKSKSETARDGCIVDDVTFRPYEVEETLDTILRTPALDEKEIKVLGESVELKGGEEREAAYACRDSEKTVKEEQAKSNQAENETQKEEIDAALEQEDNKNIKRESCMMAENDCRFEMEQERDYLEEVYKKLKAAQEAAMNEEQEKSVKAKKTTWQEENNAKGAQVECQHNDKIEQSTQVPHTLGNSKEPSVCPNSDEVTEGKDTQKVHLKTDIFGRSPSLNTPQEVSQGPPNTDFNVQQTNLLGRRSNTVDSTQDGIEKQNMASEKCIQMNKVENSELLRTEKELADEQAKQLEEKEREREREKDRIAVERATREAQERALADARERAQRIAVERVTAEARQRALKDAREKADFEKATKEARLRAERAAVERATAEARERAAEKARAENAAADAKDRAVRFNASKDKNGSHITQFQRTGSNFQGYSGEGESALRCKARLERHQRTAERAAKALAEKNRRDILAQREQAERDRLAEYLDAEVKRWSTGKEGNLRALLSTLQYILGTENGWQPIPLQEVVTAAAVKKAYRKATLFVHPDKLQQRGASIQQKYICEKVFDLLKEAWNRFNSEER